MSRHLLVIGAQRCGTTYLHTLLEAHPDIAMARPARPEPKVFLSGETAARGIDWYRRTYFAHATTEQVLGEKSTSYLEHPTAAERARRVLGPAEVVVLLRDPVHRAVSNWAFSSDNGLEERPLEQALLDNLAGSRGWDAAATSVSPFAYLERGRYADHLDPWLAAFPDSTHVLFLNELVEDDGVITGLYRSLGVSADALPSGRRRHRVNRSTTAAPDLAPALLEDLRSYFSDSDAALERRLGRSLPWRGRVAGGANV